MSTMLYDIPRIKHEMAKQFLSERQLAKKAKVAVMTVHRIFNGEPFYPETIGKLVHALKKGNPKLNPEDFVLTPTEAVDLPEPRSSSAQEELLHSAGRGQ